MPAASPEPCPSPNTAPAWPRPDWIMSRSRRPTPWRTGWSTRSSRLQSRPGRRGGGPSDRSGRREGDVEGRAPAFLALDPGPTAVAFGDVPDDGQAQPRAALAAYPRLVHLVEALEDPGQVGIGNPDAVVLHG